MKLATGSKIHKRCGIMLLNLAVLAMLALVLSNKISHEHQAAIESAVRASHKLVKAVVDTRDMALNDRVGPDRCTSEEAEIGTAHAMVVITGRFE
jgi:hypothetical protein